LFYVLGGLVPAGVLFARGFPFALTYLIPGAGLAVLFSRVRGPRNRELWTFLLGGELDLQLPEPDWLDLPAVGRTSLSTPEALDPFAKYNEGKPYADQVKPFGFGLTCYVDPLGYPLDADPLTFHLVAPFERDAQRWRELPWFDLTSRKEYAIRTARNPSSAAGDVVVVKSYRDVLEAYVNHPEDKLAGPDGEPCGPQTRGLLRRREVTVIEFTHIGKEARDYDKRLEGMVHDIERVQNEYVDDLNMLELVGLVLRGMPKRDRAAIAFAAGVHPRTLERILGEAVVQPHKATLRRLVGASARQLRKQARLEGRRLAGDDVDCLLADLRRAT